MQTAWAVLSSASFGALAALFIKSVLDHRSVSRAARRSFYVDLLTVLAARREWMKTAAMDQSTPEPNIPNERIDVLNALLLIDATKQVKERAKLCFGLLNRFQVSIALHVPVEGGDGGVYNHRFDLVRKQEPETVDLVMRMSLGKIADEFGAGVDSLADRIRREIHGR